MKLYKANYNIYDYNIVEYVYVIAKSYEHAIKLFKMKHEIEISSISIMKEEVIFPINEQLDKKIKPLKTEIIKKHNDELHNVEEQLYVSLCLTKEESSFLSQYIDLGE